MGTNSIRSNLDRDSIINSVRLALSADIRKCAVFVIVEGEDDWKLLRKFCNSNVTIYESFSGKCGIQEIIENKFIKDKRVIGIRDRDYCKDQLHNRIFFYDNSCLEMMMVAFDEVYDSVHCEFYHDNLEVVCLKQSIFEELFHLSMLRKYNEEECYKMKFEGLSLSKSIDNSLRINYEKLIDEIKKRSKNCSVSIQNLYDGIVQMQKPQKAQDYLDLVNGHDFIEMFQIHCNNTCRKRDTNRKQIASSLRTSFSKSLFSQTSVFLDLTEYCKSEGIVVWSF